MGKIFFACISLNFDNWVSKIGMCTRAELPNALMRTGS